MKCKILTLLLFCFKLFATQGIVVAAGEKYMEYLLPSLDHLRTNLKCQLPIEIWHSGDELSDASKGALAKFGNITFHDIAVVLKVPPERYRGWHIKPWIIYLSSFDEVILIDADAYVYEDPSLLFSHPGYKETGAFFFRDRSIWVMPDTYGSGGLYFKRRDFLRSLIATPSRYLPSDWRLFWTEEIPTAQSPFPEHHVESGCLAINKNRHKKALECVIQLNENGAHTYQYFHGDKETFWIGFEIAKESYYVNQRSACELRTPNHWPGIYLCHFLDTGTLFFSQKQPWNVEATAYFWDESPHRTTFYKLISREEREKVLQTYQMLQKHSRPSPKEIAVITAAIGDRDKESVRAAIENKRKYSEKHGYDFICLEDNLDSSRHPAWSKIKQCQQTLETGKYKWVFWTNADSPIMNFATKLEELIDEKYNLIIGLDKGQFFLKNSPWSLAFLDDVYQQTQFLSHSSSDEAAISHLLDSTNKYRRFTKIAPNQLF